jgi:hypothetical protein
VNILRYYVETLVKVAAKGIPVAGIVPLVFGRSRTEHTQQMTILECPQCCSNRAIILNTTPLRARCADCDTTYAIKTINPQHDAVPQTKQRPGGHKRKRDELPPIIPVAPLDPREIGALTEYIEATVKGGPEALRAAQREAKRLSKKLGIEFEAKWLLKTKWLEQTASLSRNGSMNGHRPTRVRVRAIMAWRARWLAVYAMGFSKMMACRKAHVGIHTVNFHLNNDPDFAAQAEAAKAHAIDLLHTRAFQRCLEGDLEPIYWQGVKIDHVRKFDSRLMIEMLRAHMPNKFKTPGTGQINVDTGDKILVMDEATRAKLMAARREALLDMPTTQEGEEERRRKEAQS